ncbi:MAG: pyruvate, phosphate dikinase [Clostridiales Family XIII bacterium]|jgi:pyruvate,orthophosphate dikinase|nr:pyruvate, phosphate dikinase [Clostridiales Family XIII bacterium]
MGKKYVYLFSEGDASMRELLGGKGANLAEMTALGMPVPQGFTITTEACTQYYEDGERISEEVREQVLAFVTKLEEITGKKFGDPKNPLLVSVRSGARASMPGMMDTILNLGLNETVVESFAEKTGNPRFAYDSYRRFIQMYSDVVMEVGKSYFEKLIDEMKAARGVSLDTELTADDLKELAAQFKEEYRQKTKKDFPTDPVEQLFGAIEAVFRSWNNERAIYYRLMNDIPSSWGTAVNVQSMVFGNMGDTSGTGVAFSRNPSTGEKGLFGEYLMNAQGEDVVAGVRTPQPIADLREQNPAVYEEFAGIVDVLEKHYRDMQDMEFTIEDGKLYMLQTRNGKRTAAAAVKIACDLVDEGMIDKKAAVSMIDPKSLDALLHPQFDPAALAGATPIGRGLPASPGAATGQVVFSAEEATNQTKKLGRHVILVRLETSPEDIEGMHYAQGILTARGGMTSHAAVVARGMGTCCVSGLGDISFSEDETSFTLGGKVYKEGDFISLDGSTGNVYGEEIRTVPASIGGDFERLMAWADEFRVLRVRANADTPTDARQARKFGAEGIGLCRTEHMFFEPDRISAIREMIVSDTPGQRWEALSKILPMQRGDFENLFEAMEGRPVTIRLLDPPLHEFLPSTKEEIEALAESMGIPAEQLRAKIDSLHEFNPMMGHRGARLDVTYPEIGEMQTRAIIEAAIAVQKAHPEWQVVPEIMVPLIGSYHELVFVKDIIDRTAGALIKDSGVALDYKVGTMIEIPRAALRADMIAEDADFFSFGTNDLTQMVFGFSRDDAGSFLPAYYKNSIYENDPFQKLDRRGVGKLIKQAIESARETKPDIKLGVCGEHGGDPVSIQFFYEIGIEYVSCSPYRVPIARLAAAQASLA